MLAELSVRYLCRALLLPPGGPLLLALAGLMLLGRRPRNIINPQVTPRFPLEDTHD